MKRFITSFMLVGFALGLASCAEVEKMGVGRLPRKVSPPSTVIAGDGFKEGEVLCAIHEGRDLLENTYYVAKVVNPASPQTRNQAEVIFVHNGKQMWTKYVIPSHKATKEEIKLGTIVLRHVWASGEDISAESYRKQYWQFGRVSSTDDLFKGVVEVKGQKSNVKWLRIPDKPIE
jgi:hypothetical protein